MTDSSSKLLQIQGKWYQERKPKQKYKTWAEKKSKNYSEPFLSEQQLEMATLIDVLSFCCPIFGQRTPSGFGLPHFQHLIPDPPGVVSPMIDHDILLYDIQQF